MYKLNSYDFCEEKSGWCKYKIKPFFLHPKFLFDYSFVLYTIIVPASWILI